MFYLNIILFQNNSIDILEPYRNPTTCPIAVYSEKLKLCQQALCSACLLSKASTNYHFIAIKTLIHLLNHVLQNDQNKNV